MSALLQWLRLANPALTEAEELAIDEGEAADAARRDEERKRRMVDALRNGQIAALGLGLAHEIVREHENLEDRAPVEPECGDCNLGTGPHKRYCAYHQARRLIERAKT